MMDQKQELNMQLTLRATRLFTLALKNKESLNLNPFSTLVYFLLHPLIHVLVVVCLYVYICFVSMCFVAWCFD
jgi:hypothetical protein